MKRSKMPNIASAIKLNKAKTTLVHILTQNLNNFIQISQAFRLWKAELNSTSKKDLRSKELRWQRIS